MSRPSPLIAVILYATLGVGMGLPVAAKAMSVDEAYRAIPHNRTNFDPSTAGMSAVEHTYLDRVFELINQAIVLRVETGQRLGNDTQWPDAYPRYLRSITSIREQLRQLNTPIKLWPVRNLLDDVFENHRHYFERQSQLRQAGQPFSFDANDPPIARSHAKLIDAYNILMGLYPHETKANQQAFFDHLCALDFI